MKSVLKVLVMAVVFGAIGFFIYKNSRDIKSELLKEEIQPPMGGEFSLETINGPVDLKSFSDKYLFLYFGYTYCPDICPTSLGFLSNAIKNLGIDKEARILFITVDPERDTFEKMKNYMSYFSAQITSLRGTLEETDKIAKSYGAYFRKEKINSAMNYAVDHSAKIYFINNSGKIIETFNHGISLDEFKVKFKSAASQMR